MSRRRKLRVGGIVLCGGRSTRMGRPKLDLPFGPESMLQRVVRILRQAASPVVVIAAPGQKLPPLPENTMVERDEQQGLGPLAGLARGLSVLRPLADAAYASSCDAPLLKPAFVERMIALLDDHDAAVPRDGEHYHPLAAVYRTRLAADAHQLVAAGRLRPLYLIEQCDCRFADLDELRSIDEELDSLRNTNTPDDYASALRAAGFAAGDSG